MKELRLTLTFGIVLGPWQSEGDLLVEIPKCIDASGFVSCPADELGLPWPQPLDFSVAALPKETPWQADSEAYFSGPSQPNGLWHGRRVRLLGAECNETSDMREFRSVDGAEQWWDTIEDVGLGPSSLVRVGASQG